jgi:hypothetical protein
MASRPGGEGSAPPDKIDNSQRYSEKPGTDREKQARRASANRILTILRAALNRAFEDELVPHDLPGAR